MKKLIILILLLFIAIPCLAANKYILASASGTGSGDDWTNAYTTLPATLIRGDTYYVGDGTYGGYTFDDAAQGSTYITIKKATSSDHGTSTGWQTSYGDGQALFTGQLTFATSYWLFDGVTGGGPGSWETGYGFKIKRTGSGTKAIRFDSNPAYITVRHVDIENSGVDVDGTSDTIYTLGCDYVTISHCWVHNTNRTNLLINGSTNFTIEYCLISDRHNTDGIHGEHLSANGNGLNANHIYRYNIWRDAGGANTGVIVIKDSVQSGFKIYGNIFYDTNWDSGVSSNGIITDSTGDSTTNVKVYNNTFLPIQSNSDHIAPPVSWDVSTDNDFKNNIVITSGYAMGGTGFTGTARSYNLYDNSTLASGETGGQYFSSGVSTLFNNPASNDYTLKIATDAGLTLGSEYDTDMVGNTRGSDGTWDRGAYEYDSGAGPSGSVSCQGISGNGYKIQ